jgi:hypothetical protein
VKSAAVAVGFASVKDAVLPENALALVIDAGADAVSGASATCALELAVVVLPPSSETATVTA